MSEYPSLETADTAFPNLSEQVARRISDTVISGEFPPGAHLREQEFSDRFSVSRGTIREAMRILEREGVVMIIPRKGAKVTSLTKGEVREIYEVREVLFGQAAALCAERRSDAHADTLNELLNEMSRQMGKGDVAAYAKLSHRLAIGIIKEGRNSRIHDIFVRMSLQIARYTNLGLQETSRRKESLANWRQIVDSISRRDAKTAEAMARAQIRRVKETVSGMI